MENVIHQPKLFMMLLGCTPKGRHTEQHDIFFGIANNLKELIPEMLLFWPEAKGKLHVDAWRVVNFVDNYKIEVLDRTKIPSDDVKLFFMNLGGYVPDQFEELHFKMLAVAENKASAIKQAKATHFYKTAGFDKASSHIDNKYGVDVDDIFDIADILSIDTKEKYSLKISHSDAQIKDITHLGYLPLKNIK